MGLARTTLHGSTTKINRFGPSEQLEPVVSKTKLESASRQVTGEKPTSLITAFPCSNPIISKFGGLNTVTNFVAECKVEDSHLRLL